MKTSETVAKIAESLSLAQAEIENAKLNKVNPHFKGKYADLSAILDVIKKTLPKYGIAYLQPLTQKEDGPYLETILIHKSGEWISGELKLVLDRQNLQGLGSAITYARRYSLTSLLGLSSEEDDDGNHSVEVTKKALPKIGESKPTGVNFDDWS